MSRNELAPTRARKSPDLFGFPREFDRFFDNFFTDSWPAVAKHMEPPMAFKPSVDVTDRENEYLVHAELPGMEEKDIDLTIDGDHLVLKGEKRQEKRAEEKGSLHVERSYGSFERRFTLPAEVDTDNIKASFKNGVLEVTLPKSAEAKESVKKITIG